MSNTTVKVPQDSGSIVVTTAGETKRTFSVTDGTISVPEGQLADVLRFVPGAEVKAGDAPVTTDGDADDTPPDLPPPSKDDLAVAAEPTTTSRTRK